MNQSVRMIGSFVETYMKLWYARKPTIAAVQGWCNGGGTDMVLCSDLIIAADDAKFGYPPSRVWGTPTTAMWVYRMGLEKAKRYLLTGDEISAQEAARIGLILETVPAADLQEHALAFAKRMAQVPTNQLVMLKMLCNHTVENMGFASSRLLGTFFDGVARHTQEGLDFVRRAEDVGPQQEKVPGDAEEEQHQRQQAVHKVAQRHGQHRAQQGDRRQDVEGDAHEVNR